MITGLRADCFSCSGDVSAWAALKLARSYNKSFAADNNTHSAAFNSEAPQLGVSSKAETRNWREGLRALYCRSLARSISDALFNSAMPMPLGSEAAQRSEAVTPATVLPSSWLQLGLQRVPNVERLRAAFVERIGRARVLDMEHRKAGQSIILDKAA